MEQITKTWTAYKQKQTQTDPDPAEARQQVVQAAIALLDEAQGPVQRLFEFTFNVRVY